MKNANGYGSISKLSGRRRKPWCVRITDGWVFDEATMKKKQIQRVLGCYAKRDEAIKALANYNDHPFELSNLSVTFGTVYEEAKKDFSAGRKNNYHAAYNYLKRIADMPIRSIKASHMQACIDACDTTQQREIKTECRKVFETAMRLEIVDRNPALYLKSNTVETSIERVLFTPDEIQFIQAAADNDVWWAKVTIMLLYSGLRTKELRTLDPDNIDIDAATFAIVEGKNKASLRVMPIHSHVLPLFSEYKAAGCNLFGYTHDGLNKALKTQIKGVVHHAHDTRHTFTTKLHENKIDLLVIQRLLGHTPQTITERVYTHLSIDELRSALETLNFVTYS